MGLISGIFMGTIFGIALMAGWRHMMRYRSNKRIAKAVDIKLLGSLSRDDLKKICGDNFPDWISFPVFEQLDGDVGFGFGGGEVSKAFAKLEEARDFVGKIREQFKYYLVNWDIVYTPLREAHLGIHKLAVFNQALLGSGCGDWHVKRKVLKGV
ncbi:hypothetical protein CsSME_00024085 [Camellia sinensis var. sinensis]